MEDNFSSFIMQTINSITCSKILTLHQIKILKTMIKAFRIITLLEGFSLLVLLFLAMPLKYIWNLPQMVQVVGMVHGILFLLFVVMAIMVFYELKWSLKTFIIVMFASVIPFGAIYIDKKHLKL
jgi:integral membrane protein